MGVGFQAVGAKTVAYIENNLKFQEWLAKHSDIPVIAMDVNTPEAIAKAHEFSGGSPVVAAGVSCQPFSSLGDQRQFQDERSSTFGASLKLGYFLRSPMIILECTKEVSTSQAAQEMLTSFSTVTGYKLAQTVLNLHEMWPSQRTRWWAVLAHPAFDINEIPSMPVLPFRPGLLHIQPGMPKMTDEELKQILLDTYELSMFNSQPGGLSKFSADFMKPAPTATHSWGTQLSPCFCLCRKEGFSLARIDSRGLYAMLIPLGYCIEVGQRVFHQMRHPHPREVALWNGLRPDFVSVDGSFPLKLELAAVGQLASPLQSAWVMASAFQQAAMNGFWVTDVTPNDAVYGDIVKVWEARDNTMNIPPTIYTNIFEEQIRILLGQASAMQDPPPAPVEEQVQEINDNFTQEFLRSELNVPRASVSRSRSPADRHPETHHADHPEESSQGGVPSRHVGESSDVHNSEGDTIYRLVDRDDAHDTYAPNGGVMMFALPQTSPQVHAPEATIASGAQPTEHRDEPRHRDTEEVAEAGTSFVHHHRGEDQDEEGEHMPFVQDHQAIHEDHAIEPTEVVSSPDESGHSSDACADTEDHTEAMSELGENPVNHEAHHPSFDQHHQDHIVIHATPQVSPTATWTDEEQVELWIGHKGLPLIKTKASPKATVVHDKQILLLRPMSDPDIMGCLRADSSATIPELRGLTRMEALWHQQGWVALDEMTWYLQMINQFGDVGATPPMIMEGNANDAIRLGQWVVEASTIATANTSPAMVSTVLWKDHHWFPISVLVQEEMVSVRTSHKEKPYVDSLVEFVFGTDPLVTCDLSEQSPVKRTVFPADCGFQSIAWIMGLGATHDGIMQAEEATKWRIMFAQDLVNAGTQYDEVPLILGGMNNEVLKSPRPWKDLKMRASSMRPPYQLVLSEELQKQIDARAAQGGPVGKKSNKKASKPPSKPVVTLLASQVNVPNGIFQQTDGTSLAQINIQQVQQCQRGIIIANFAEAEPFFRLKDKICREGLGLIVLDVNDARLPPQHVKVQFPAICAETSEPMIITGALYQLGHQEVSRTQPKDMVKVEQIETRLLRVVIHKDQFPHDWSSFSQSPVKAIMALPTFQQVGKDCVLDVFDRQFMTKRYQRVRPDQADLFSVSIRLKATACEAIWSGNAKGGVYYEPRSDSGRQPDAAYRVVWLPEHSFSEVVAVQQTVTPATWITRAGDRWGLRAGVKDVEAIHKSLKPETTYLDSSQAKQYRISPPPFGTTKQSLQRVFDTWGWAARPIQVLGQAANMKGLVWLAQATHQPSHWIYTTDQGDLLISEHEQRKYQPPNHVSTPVASERTLQHLSRNGTQQPAKERAGDPWLQSDPWKHYQPTAAVGADQIASIEANVQRRVIEAMQEQGSTSTDSTMDDASNTRVSNLEQQVHSLQTNFQQLAQTVNTHHQQQCQLNTQVAGQINSVQQQQANMQTSIENRLDEQMKRIEELLTQPIEKRFKTGGE
eukprot:Skav214153  [mRNA]  locus=scaffold1645:294723:299374:- [translate_table: standard]